MLRERALSTRLALAAAASESAQIGLGFSCASRYRGSSGGSSKRGRGAPAVCDRHSGYARKDATDGIIVHDLQAELDIVEHDLGAQEARKIDID